MALRRAFRADRGAPAGAPGESYRILRSNLLVALADLERPTVIITSAAAGEGKTRTTCNLAVALAAAGRRVMVVDLDLRHPDLHRQFGLPAEPGVSDVLLERAPLDETLHYVEVIDSDHQAPRALYVLTAGSPVSNPSELLGAGRSAKMLESLARSADVVLIDTPPVLLVADTLVIGRMVAGAVLVVETNRTPIPTLQQAKDTLIRNQTRLLGVVLNKFEPRAGEHFTYGYGYPADGGRDEA